MTPSSWKTKWVHNHMVLCGSHNITHQITKLMKINRHLAKNSLFKEKTALNNIYIDINYILPDLKSHWLHYASITQRLVCKWYRREEKEESESLFYTITQ